MATLDKNFRIKNGLVIEGSTATLNGNNILSENTQAGDSYILNLVGGATLVKSVGTNLSVDNAGQLSLDLAGISSDVAGTRLYADGSSINVDVEGIYDDMIANGIATTTNVSNAQTAAQTFATDADSVLFTSLSGSIQQAYSDAVDTANSHSDGLNTAEVTNRNNAIASAISTEVTDRNDAITSAINTEVTNRNDAIADAKQEAIDHADGLINDASGASNEVWSAYKTSTEIGLAQAAAEQHADEAVAALVGSAPELLDTIQELATALENNPDIIADLENVAAGKQDTLTAGSNIDITGATISVTGLDSADISDFNSAALSATASAYDLAGAAAQAQTDAEANAQSALNNVLSGNTNFSEVAVDWMVKHVASYAFATNTEEVAYAWNKNKGASAKFLVRLKNGIHSQVSEVLVTRDDSDNLAITEYGIVTTNGVLGDITVGMYGNDIQLKVTPEHTNGTEIFVSGTLMAYTD